MAQPTGDSASRVLVFRDWLGVSSETWLYSQVGAIRRFEPHLVGSRLVGPVSLSDNRVHLFAGQGLLGRIESGATKLGLFAPRLDGIIRDISPAVAHAHFGPDGAMIAPWVSRRGIPFVVTFHGFDATTLDDVRSVSPSFHIYRRRRKWVQRNGKLFIAVSGFIRDRLISDGYPADRVVVHHIGVDLERLQPRGSYERDPVVLFVGRLVEKKGGEFLVRAMAAVQKRNPEWKLVVIGDGPLRPRLVELATKLNVSVEFLGVQPPSRVADWMARAGVFCGPSITASTGDAEGFGMVFIEAAALGTPVVATRSGGIEDAVSDGSTGLLVRERNAEELATAIQHLIDQPSLRRRLGVAGAERVRSLFDLRKNTEILETLYDRVIGQSGS